MKKKVDISICSLGCGFKHFVFAGNYEKITENGVTKEMYYIGDAIYVKQAGQAGKTLYTHKDHLGSIISITDSVGNPVFRATYDPWGKQTLNPANTFSFHRGYTGHEHLPEFELINMNARLYDPALGRMLQPDMYVANPFHTQDYNRYSYVLNNPLIFTDPSGNSIKQYLMDLYSYEGGGFWYRGDYYRYSSDVGYGGGGFISSGPGGGGGAVYQLTGYSQTTDYYTAYKDDNGTWVITNYTHSKTTYWNEWTYVGYSSNYGTEQNIGGRTGGGGVTPTHVADNTRYVVTIPNPNVPVVKDNRNILRKIDDFYSYKIVQPYKPDKWEGKPPPIIQGAVLLIPPVGLTNDGTMLFTGLDLQGNPVSPLERVLSFGSICTLGLPNGLYNLGFSIYSAGWTTYKGYQNEKK